MPELLVQQVQLDQWVHKDRKASQAQLALKDRKD